jgi:hypothetical protein
MLLKVDVRVAVGAIDIGRLQVVEIKLSKTVKRRRVRSIHTKNKSKLFL